MIQNDLNITYKILKFVHIKSEEMLNIQKIFEVFHPLGGENVFYISLDQSYNYHIFIMQFYTKEYSLWNFYEYWIEKFQSFPY